MITKLPKEFLDVISNNNGLKVNLTNLQKDVPFTERSWLYEDREPDQVLRDWMQQLERLSDGDSYERKVFQFDTSQLKKWGPQGGHEPIAELMDEIVLPTFNEAYSPTPTAFRSKLWARAVENVSIKLQQFDKVHSLRPVSYPNVVADMRARDTLESNSGWPDFSRRNNPSVLKAAISAATDGEYIEYPAIALFRRYNGKTRLVWMFPEATNIVEGSFCQPLQSAIINSNDPFFYPWKGFDHVRDLISRCYSRREYLTASDFSSTDAHFQLPATEEVYSVLQYSFQDRYRQDLKASLTHMHSIPLVISTTEWITGFHGVASGSNWTNFVETVFDYIFSDFVWHATSNKTQALCAIGDDMCWVSNHYDDALADKLNKYGEQVGQLINAEKVTNDQDSVKFLQRLFQRGYNLPDGRTRAVYSTIRALKSSVYPERFHDKKRGWNSDMFCARQYMILENCVDHPMFEDFVKFIVKGQKDLIPFAKKGKQELDVITRKSRLVPGLNPTYNQEKRDVSLADFRAIAIARDL